MEFRVRDDPMGITVQDELASIEVLLEHAQKTLRAAIRELRELEKKVSA